jgi:membrane associated rhomboid family serine protease
MTDMDQGPQLPPAPPGVEHCYRHPGEETRVHCTRCGRPICPRCMIPAPVGHQCPECVEQARREFRAGPGRHLRTASSNAPVTRILLAAILVMFVIEVVLGGGQSLFSGPPPRVMFDLGANFSAVSPSGHFIGIAGGQYWRLFTSMFLHFGLFHIAFNAYALWLFGTIVEREFGSWRFAMIYFVSGFLAGAASYAFGPPMVLAAGASGAIFGVFGAFIAYNFRRRHLAMAATNLRSAMLLIVINAFLAFAIPGIDWRAHLGGLVGGVAVSALADPDGLAGVGGSRAVRAATAVAGFVVVAAVAVALIAWRTEQLRSGAASFL